MASAAERRRARQAEPEPAGQAQNGRSSTWGGPRPNAGRKPTKGRRKKAAKPKATPTEVTLAPAEPKKPEGLDIGLLMRYGPEIVAASELHARRQKRTASNTPFKLPWFPKAAIPPRKELRMAMDALPAFSDANADWLAGAILDNIGAEGLAFPGFPLLAELAQRPEYRMMSETIADDATRKWIKFEVTGDEKKPEDKNGAMGATDEDPKLKPGPGAERDPDETEARIKAKGKTDKVKALKDEIARLELRDKFYALCRDDGLFGRTHLFLEFGNANGDLGGNPNNPEFKIPIGDGRDALSRSKVSKETPLRNVKVIEPVWCYPTTYNAINPLQPGWYDPSVWYVMGTEIHSSRLLRFVSRSVPDMLKPAYAFGGISLSQLARPYVDNWLRTRTSVSDLIHSFSVMVLQTDLSTILQPGNAGALLARVALFNALRDNQGTFVVNKATEDFKNVAAPISGLDHLQAQAQEHMASVSRIPLVKLTGISPSGLNASSEGEIRVYYDTIAAYQNRFERPNLAKVINFVQLSLWGEIDPEITFEFEPLWEMSQKEKSEKEKDDAERNEKYINMGAIAPEEVRKVIIDDPTLPYAGFDPDEVPEPPVEQGLNEPGSGKESGDDDSGGDNEKEPGGTRDRRPFGLDEWHESDHPRGQPGNAGQFGKGGGGSKASSKQVAHAPQFGLHHGKFSASMLEGFTAPTKRSNIGESIDPSKLKKIGAQKGSNPGGVYEDESGNRFYVKQGKSKDHVQNEMIAAALYDLAGTPTLKYRPVDAGTHIATEIEKLDKDNASKLSPAERAEASRDLAVHAWLANWDAVGLGGDNLGTVKGIPTALDLGGALSYRAQGAPKGKAFGDKVTELDTLRDEKINRDAAKIFGDMTPAEMRESARYVTSIPDSKIKATVEKLGGDDALANKLIARKKDIASRARFFGQQGDPTSADGTVVIPAGEKPPVKELNGVGFGSWRPPADWAAVDGQADIDEPPLEVPKGKKAASGVLIREPDGRVWLVQPRGGFGGYEATFPKGRAEEGLSLQANAIKEAYEESGLKVRITGLAGDREGDLTMTRYYEAVREGGDPSQHDDETEGVVLVPAKRAGDFLNRKRDRETLGLDEFVESQHPRDPDGKFSETGGGSSGTKHGYEGIKSPHVTYGETEKDTLVLTTQKVLSAPAPAGSNYRRLLMKLIKDGPKLGVMNEFTVADLKKKLIESLGKSASNALAAGDVTKAKKLADKMAALGATPETIAAVPKKEPAPAKKEPAKPAPAPEPKPEPPPPAPKFPPPTEAELAKAKKTVALQLQYVPGAPQSNVAKKEAQKLVDEFNAKYADKPMTSTPALIQKVNDFKMLAAKTAAITAAETAVLQAEQAKTAAEHAKKNAELMKDPAYAALKGVGGSPYKAYADIAADHEVEITPVEGGLLRTYIGAGYATLNSQLYEGVLTPEQFAYRKELAKTLEKFPAYEATVMRGIKGITAKDFMKYKPGHVVPSPAFMSAGKSSTLWGSYTLKIKSKTARDVSMLNPSEGGGEVIFLPHTHFKVISNDGKTAVLEEI